MKRKSEQVEEAEDGGIRLFASSVANVAPEGSPVASASEASKDRQPGADREGSVGVSASQGGRDDESLGGEALGGSVSEGGESAGEEDEAEARPAKKAKSNRKKGSDATKQKGVLYLSRIPPHMKPLKLRHMLSKYGDVGRLYLAPEDPSLRKKRKKFKGNTGKNFSEGWVEFNDKAVAKRVAAILNGNPMGGKKRSAYHYDLWCLKYLSKFKWEHLTEEIAYQNAVREQKMANELSAAKRERDFYMSRVDRAKAEDAKVKRRKEKSELEGDNTTVPTPDGSQGVKKGGMLGSGGPRIMRTYGQRKSKPSAEEAGEPSLSAALFKALAGQKD